MEKLQSFVLQSLGTGHTDLVSVAALAGINPRTLRRTLVRSGCTYRALLDKVRRQQALEMAISGQQSMSEIALKLGFSEVSALSRAWRRWFGESFMTSKLCNFVLLERYVTAV